MFIATRKRVTVWAAGLLAASWFIYLHTIATPGLIDRIGRFKGTDYIQFYVMGSLVLDGRADHLYDPAAHIDEGRRRIDSDLQLYASHPNYGPQVALAFAPLAMLPYGWSLTAFLLLSLAVYALSVWIVWRECESLDGWGLAVAVLAAASPLLFTVLRYGQLSAFTLLLWTMAFVALKRNHDFFAGVCIGCLAFKPQLAIVAGVAILAARQGRVIAGAAAAVVAQFTIALAVAGPEAMAQYAGVLWTLMRNPRLAQLFPSEIHSVRGFLQLLIQSERIVAALSMTALAVALLVAARIWRSTAPLATRWSALILLTILASPHLITYDLLLLTIPLMLLADTTSAVALSLLYFAPFSAIVARLMGVQVSVLVIAGVAWRLYRTSMQGYGAPMRASVAPRCDAVSSQNSTTRGWRSSAVWTMPR